MSMGSRLVLLLWIAALVVAAVEGQGSAEPNADEPIRAQQGDYQLDVEKSDTMIYDAVDGEGTELEKEEPIRNGDGHQQTRTTTAEASAAQQEEPTAAETTTTESTTSTATTTTTTTTTTTSATAPRTTAGIEAKPGKAAKSGKGQKGRGREGAESAHDSPRRNCNSELMRKLILENIQAKPSLAKRQIQAKVAAQISGKIDVVCSRHAFSYIVNSELFCEAEKDGVICLCFKQQA